MVEKTHHLSKKKLRHRTVSIRFSKSASGQEAARRLISALAGHEVESWKKPPATSSEGPR